KYSPSFEIRSPTPTRVFRSYFAAWVNIVTALILILEPSAPVAGQSGSMLATMNVQSVLGKANLNGRQGSPTLLALRDMTSLVLNSRQIDRGTRANSSMIR